MSVLELVVVALAGVAAGAINTIAGAGSLLTFPVLIWVGLSPLSANVTNDLGVIPGNVSGAIALRHQLAGQRPRLARLVPVAALGSIVGAALLLAFPAKAFELVAPVLLLAAAAITAGQPALSRWVQAQAYHDRGGGRGHHRHLRLAILAIAVYGGYFGTGIGVLFFAALGVFVDDTPARNNATKQILALVTNVVAGILFAFVAPVRWSAALALAVGSGAGGPLGARLSTIISPRALRTVVCVVAVAASIYLLARYAI